MSYRLMDNLMEGIEWGRAERANGMSPNGMFETTDGVLQMAIRSDAEFRRLCTALGRPDVADDERFANPGLRTVNHDAVNAAVAEPLRALSLEQALEILADAEILATPINSLGQAARHPQAQARNMFGKLPHGAGGKIPFIRNPNHFSETPLETYRAAPVLGADTDAVLSELAGLSAQDIADLRARGVIG